MIVPVLVGTSFIDKYGGDVFPGERKIVAYNSESVPILVVFGKSERKEKRPFRVVRTTNLAPLSEPPVLVGTSASRLVQGSPRKSAKEHTDHMTAFGIVDVFLNRPFKKVVANPDITVVTLANLQRIAVTKAPQFLIIHNNTD